MLFRYRSDRHTWHSQIRKDCEIISRITLQLTLPLWHSLAQCGTGCAAMQSKHLAQFGTLELSKTRLE
jgi:hypothetical protein